MEKLYIKTKWTRTAYSSFGCCRVFINNEKTKYYASGYGYDKESAAFAEYINNNFNEEDIKNIKSYKGGTDLISYGIGMGAIENIFNELGYTLEKYKDTKRENHYTLTKK